jgi:hypothetical protein
MTTAASGHLSLELEKQLTYFAANNGLTNVANQSEATAWFMG